MRKIFLLLLLGSLPVSSWGQKSAPAGEEVILNDLLTEIGRPDVSTHIRILQKMGKFNLLPAELPVVTSPSTAGVAKVTQTGLFIPADRRPFLHNQVPSQPEFDNPTIHVSLAKGQKTFAVFGIFPTNELTGVEVSVSELKDSAGKDFPADKVRIYFVKHLLKSSDQYVFRPYPFGLQPLDSPLGFHPGIADDFLIEIDAPESIHAGIYRGKLLVSGQNLALEKEISVQLLDFTLLRPNAERMNWGFYCSLNESHPADYKFMAAYGLNTIVIPAGLGAPYLAKIREIREAGITGLLLIDVGALDNQVVEERYSKPWEEKYKQVVAAFDQQMQAAGEAGRYIGLIHDEPRESMVNPWNRTYAQMPIYHRLIGEAAPDIRRGANPMVDGPISAAHPNGIYADFAKCFEMVMPHYWAPCKNIIQCARSNPKCRLWSYNDGDNRLAWGFHSWKVGLQGRTVYNYRPYTSNEHPLSPVYMGSREFEGRSFTGNYVVAWKDKIWGTVTLLNMFEGMNDYRYVYTLEKLIEQAPHAQKKVAKEAKAYLEELKKEIPEYAHSDGFTDGKESGSGEARAEIVNRLDTIRAKLAEYIIRLRGREDSSGNWNKN